jgi:hypothetical protein
MHLNPSDEQAVAFFSREIDGPINMLNMLRFKQVADYSAFPDLDPGQPLSGAEAYDRYIAHTLPFLHASGGSVTYLGTGGDWFVGPTDERWDLVLLTTQASMQSFLAFSGDADYLAGMGHRTAALEDARLLPCIPQDR